MDTVKELVERGIRVYESPGGVIWQQLFLSSPNEAYQKMGANMYISNSWDEFNNITAEMAAEGGWCQIASYMTYIENEVARKLHPQGRGYWESKELLSERRYFKQITDSEQL